MWKTIEEFSNYLVSADGRIYSTLTNIVLSPGRSNGYFMVVLRRNGKGYSKKIHRLVGVAFIKNPKNLPVLNHKDGNKSNNNVNNLEWCTSSYNQKHAYKIGTKISVIKGIKNVNCKLSPEKIKKIRELYLSKKYSQAEIGKMYAVSQVNIGCIVRKETWI